jgi:flavodoxin I
MKKALIAYATMSGNTFFLAQFVQNGLQQAGFNVVLKEVKQTKAEELKDYDLVVLASSTWLVDGKQGQLTQAMKDFLGKLKDYDFGQRPVAVYGVGHHSYTFTCKAADSLEEFVRDHNGKLVAPVFKADDVVDSFAISIEEWASQIRV